VLPVLPVSVQEQASDDSAQGKGLVLSFFDEEKPLRALECQQLGAQ
jgi:hypothetical protein